MTGAAVRPGPAGGVVLGRRSAVGNFAAQGAALAIVSLASLLVARSGGAAVLGAYSLLRILPWLCGVVFSCGLPFATSYFMGRHRDDPALRPTLVVLAGAGTLAGSLVWVALIPVLHRVLLEDVPVPLLVLATLTVATQLWTVWAKASCQGSADLRGANLIIVCEELCFLPAYGACLLAGLSGIHAVVVAMLGGGVAATAIGIGRIAHDGFFRGWRRPSPALARSVVSFGARGQLGNLLWLVNLRLDFIVLGAIAGPATLGVYAVSSKFAELMRVPAAAVNYVLYPRFTRADTPTAAAEARRLLPRAAVATLLAAPVLAAASVIAIPLLFGSAFRGAILPACVLLIGLAVEGAAAVASAYLWGSGRPGANTVGMAVGVVVTVALDVLLIPHHGALGAAVASSVAYLVTTALLTRFTWSWSGRDLDPACLRGSRTEVPS